MSHLSWILLTLLAVSILGNIVLGFRLSDALIGIGYMGATEQQIHREQANLVSVRSALCAEGAEANLAGLESWAHQQNRHLASGADGLLWAGALGFQVDELGEVVGICAPRSTWGAFDGGGEACPMHPVC